MGRHVYETFYHKVSGDLMRIWMPKIADFQYAIWEKLRSGETVEEILYVIVLLLTLTDPFSWEFLWNHFVFLDSSMIPVSVLLHQGEV